MDQKRLIISKLLTGTLTISDFNIRNAFTNSIINKLPKSTLLGKGAVGRVYMIDDKYVVKQTKPCIYPSNTYCTDLYTPITTIPGGSNNDRTLLANLLSEIAIGFILDGDFTVKTISSFVLNENEIYIIMERLTPLIINNQLSLNLNYPPYLIFYLFQLAYSLLNYQEYYQFTHYDLHTANQLYKLNNKTLTFPLPNQNKQISINCPFIIKLADFALSRLKINNVILSPTEDQFPIKSFGEFNPSYDFAAVLGSLLFFHEKDLDVKLYKFIEKLTLWYFKDNSKPTNIKNYIAATYYKVNKNGKPSYRLKQDGDYILYCNTRSLIDVVDYLAKNLINSKLAIITNTININYYKRYQDIKLFTPNKLHTFSDIKIVKKHFTFDEPPAIYNFTIDRQQIKNCPTQNQYLTLLHIPYFTSFTFFYDCCKLDAVNYILLNDEIKLVINGGFFDLKGDYLPIGPYRDKYNFINKNKIPKLYQNDYGYVILNNNKLTITHNYIPNVKIFASGPLLISNNKNIFNPYQKKFMCTEPKYAKELNIAENDRYIMLKGIYKYNNNCDKTFIPHSDIYYRCDKINCGELSHVDNPNPRTVFCTLKNGDYLFVAVEGRGKNGDGLDLYKLSQILLNNFDVDMAINLDGGRSSTFAWRHNNKVYFSNPLHNYYYPNGFIIGLK